MHVGGHSSGGRRKFESRLLWLLTPEFGEDRAKATQWTAFLRKGKLRNAPPSLTAVTSLLDPFLMPPTLAIAVRQKLDMEWPKCGPRKQPTATRSGASTAKLLEARRRGATAATGLVFRKNSSQIPA